VEPAWSLDGVRHPQPARMVPIKRQRRRLGHPGKPTSQILAPNDVWSGDYKGNSDRRWPVLLSADGRGWIQPVPLGVPALTSTAVDEAKPIFTRLFHEYGLPTGMRSDNGVPFATPRWPACRNSRRGGSAWASCRS